MPNRNMDGGHMETEAILKDIENRITREYQQAEHEIQLKLDDYLRRFQTKDALKRKALENGLITRKEYDQWRLGQLMVGERWSKMRDTIAGDLTHTAQLARLIAYQEMPEVYALNFNYGTYMADVLSEGRLAAGFTLYSKDAVAVLFKDGEFYHGPGRRTTSLIAAGKQLAWDKKQIQSVMMQGILQGESISKLATRLSTTVGDSDRKAAIRNARTMATGVQNAGRSDSIRRANSIAEKYGLKVYKQWCATLDGRTRHWHAELDGVSIPEKESFVNDYGEIEYPGDPGADPANVYNCRCSLLSAIEGLGFNNSLHPSVTGRELGKDLNGISYEEWKAGHYTQHSDRITKQDEIAEVMRWSYGAEYRRYANLPDKGLNASGRSGILKLDLQFFAEQDLKRQSETAIRKGIRSLENEISKHASKIADPLTNCEGWDSKGEEEKAGLIRHWQKEISNFEESIQNRKEELRKRGIEE